MYEESVSAALKAAKKMLVQHGWTKGEYARDNDGIPVDPLSPSAASFCAAGAVLRASQELDLADRESVEDKAFHALSKAASKLIVLNSMMRQLRSIA